MTYLVFARGKLGLQALIFLAQHIVRDGIAFEVILEVALTSAVGGRARFVPYERLLLQPRRTASCATTS